MGEQTVKWRMHDAFLPFIASLLGFKKHKRVVLVAGQIRSERGDRMDCGLAPETMVGLKNLKGAAGNESRSHMHGDVIDADVGVIL